MPSFLDLLRCLLCCEHDDLDYHDHDGFQSRIHIQESSSSITGLAHQSIEHFKKLYAQVSLNKEKQVSEDPEFPPLLSVSASSYNSHSPTPKPPKPIPKQSQSSYDSPPSTSKPLKPAISSSEQHQSSSYKTLPSPRSSSAKPPPSSPSPQKLPAFRPPLSEVASSQAPPTTSKTAQSVASQTWPSPQNSSIEPSPSPSSILVPKPSTQSFSSSLASFNGPPSPSSLSSSSSQNFPTFKPALQKAPKNVKDHIGNEKSIWVKKSPKTWPTPQNSPTEPSPSSFKVSQTSTFRSILKVEVASDHASLKPSKTAQSSASQMGPSPGFSSHKPSPSSIWVPNPSSQSLSSSRTSFNEPPSPSSSSSSSSHNFPTFKPTLCEAPTNVKDHEGNEKYIWVEKGSLPLYMIPEDMKDLIKNEIVPEVLKKPLSPVTYKDFFAALLYAEEYYFERWSDYQMENVTLEFKKASVTKGHKRHKNFLQKKKKRHKNISNGRNEPDDKIFVQFNIDPIPENRPFLLSRDLVYARLSGSSEVEPFQGVIFRVEGRENIVLVEFEEDFLFQHDFTQKYDISFSFNRVCLKRAHQALNAVSGNLIQNFLFPEFQTRISIPIYPVSLFEKYDSDISSTASRILSIRGSPPYLIAGPLCVPEGQRYSQITEPSKTGKVVCEAVVRIYKSSPECRILISAPSNSACDVLMRSLKKVIPESDMFRANAAFRGILEVPEDILSSCLYEEECFACPSLDELRRFRVIFSTFMSSYRLHNEGLHAGHFSHVFLVDASSAIEPEALVTLANFSDTGTTVVVTGRHGNSSSWVRSGIARRRGLRTSYFERLCQCTPYTTLNPHFFTDLGSPADGSYM